MSKIHPSEVNCDSPKKDIARNNFPTVLTVWKKSSMSFQGTDGFTVYNHEGKLAFRVDNYSRKNISLIGGLVLMDGAGTALMTLKPQILSMQHQWNGFKGEDVCRKLPVFMMRRRSLIRSNDETEIFMGTRANIKDVGIPDFRVVGSFQRRKCTILGPKKELVAEISRKKQVNTAVVLSEDVFSLVVHPGYDSKLIMAFVVIMDRICRKQFTPVFCS